MIQRTDKAFRSPLEASRRSKNCLRLGNIWDRKDLEKIQETLEDIPNQGLGNDGLQTKPSPLPICTECYRNTAMPVCLCIIYGCLCTMVAELSSSPKPKILIICPTEKICHIVFKLGSKEQQDPLRQRCQTHFHQQPHQPHGCLQRAECNFRTV